QCTRCTPVRHVHRRVVAARAPPADLSTFGRCKRWQNCESAITIGQKQEWDGREPRPKSQSRQIEEGEGNVTTNASAALVDREDTAGRTTATLVASLAARLT